MTPFSHRLDDELGAVVSPAATDDSSVFQSQFDQRIQGQFEKVRASGLSQGEIRYFVHGFFELLDPNDPEGPWGRGTQHGDAWNHGAVTAALELFRDNVDGMSIAMLHEYRGMDQFANDRGRDKADASYDAGTLRRICAFHMAPRTRSERPSQSFVTFPFSPPPQQQPSTCGDDAAPKSNIGGRPSSGMWGPQSSLRLGGWGNGGGDGSGVNGRSGGNNNGAWPGPNSMTNNIAASADSGTPWGNNGRRAWGNNDGSNNGCGTRGWGNDGNNGCGARGWGDWNGGNNNSNNDNKGGGSGKFYFSSC
jgi:hypothetical protein